VLAPLNAHICTAQVLLAVLAAAYGIYHGAKGLKKIATEVHSKALTLAKSFTEAGFTLQRHTHCWVTECVL
jgi:glycine dehydrogenase